MQAKDADALDCDFAEYYGVIDREALPPGKAAALAAGLPPESRIRRRLTGERAGLRDQLLAVIADRLGELVWAKTKDAQKGRNRPRSILQALRGEERREPKQMAFDTPEAFEAALRAAREA